MAADAGWVPQGRFIGTTGVTVNPRLYLAFGISGAVQHVTGLGSPDHIIAVNTDASAPMMSMADLAIVTDETGLLKSWPPTWEAPTMSERFDVAVVGARTGQGGSRPRAGPGRPIGRPTRTGPVPRLQEHVRRSRLRPHPRPAHPGLVGGRPLPAVGHPPL